MTDQMTEGWAESIRHRLRNELRARRLGQLRCGVSGGVECRVSP